MILKLLAVQAILAPAQGDVPERPPAVAEYDGAAGQLEIATPRLEDPDINIDGRLDDAAWEGAALLRNFSQYDPVEGIPAVQPTEALVLVSDDAIYFGVRAYDSDPGGVRASLSERDSWGRADDYIRVVLDTFNDRRRAYNFMVNAYGVQQDGIWVEGGQGGGGGGRGGRGGGGGGGGGRRGGGFGPPPVDYNPDFIWESDGRLDDQGYTVEMRIPFKSIRFQNVPLQSWGINIMRRVQRTGYQQSWAPLSRDRANQLEQSGTLDELQDLDPGLFLEINPVATGKRLGAYDSDAGAFQHDDPVGDFGFYTTYGLTSNLTLDGTYNPDFSQVEADAGQIAVNERFALFFPEKRPFFLEGMDIFQLPKQLVYTRSVVDPIAGAKITGKVGSFNVGYMGAVDQVASSSSANDAVVNLVRLRRDLGTSSTFGLTYTDRTRSTDVFNRVMSADTRLVMGGRYTLQLIGAGSVRGLSEGGSEWGSLTSANFARTGRTFSFNGEFENIEPAFEAASGFIRRVGLTQMQGNVSLNSIGRPGDLIERWGPSLSVRTLWDHDTFWNGGKTEESEIRLTGTASFRNNITLFLTGTRTDFFFPASDYGGLFTREPSDMLAPLSVNQSHFEGLYGGSFFLMASSWSKVRGNIRFSWGETPLFYRTLDVPIETAEQYSGSVSLNLYPFTSLQAEVGVNHETLIRKRGGGRYSSATIPRIRAQYQFTKALFLRSIVEYAHRDQEPLLNPVSGLPLEYCPADACSALSTSIGHDVHVEVLLSYEPSPGTVMYVGYSREMEDTGAFRFQRMRPQADGLFAKVSYRFRL